MQRTLFAHLLISIFMAGCSARPEPAYYVKKTCVTGYYTTDLRYNHTYQALLPKRVFHCTEFRLDTIKN